MEQKLFYFDSDKSIMRNIIIPNKTISIHINNVKIISNLEYNNVVLLYIQYWRNFSNKIYQDIIRVPYLNKNFECDFPIDFDVTTNIRICNCYILDKNEIIYPKIELSILLIKQ